METTQMVTCQNCRQTIPASFKYCNKCGHKVPAAENPYKEAPVPIQNPYQTNYQNHYPTHPTYPQQQTPAGKKTNSPGILIWSIINTCFLFVFVLPILALVNALKARKTNHPAEIKSYEKKAILFNLITYGLVLLFALTCCIVLLVSSNIANSTKPGTAPPEIFSDFSEDDIPFFEDDSPDFDSNDGQTGITPITFSAFENSYSITGYEISIADNQTTVITIYGTGFDVLPLRDGRMQIPAWINFESGGQLFESVSATTTPDSISYEFETSATPEKIIIEHGDTWEEIISITP